MEATNSINNPEDLADDKQLLRSIVNNDYVIPKAIDSFEFAQALLKQLGSSDEELRDEFSYMILARGILEQNKLTGEQLEQLLGQVLSDKHLFYHIGEAGNDTVFMRSFSNLIIAAILYTDASKPTLSKQHIQQVKQALTRYAQEEKDWRGYIEGKGWSHSMAHLADALDIYAQHPHTTGENRKDVLVLLSQLIKNSAPLFSEEDVRLATVAYHIILGKQVDTEFIKNWLQACSVQRGADIRSWRRATNVKNFLRSLYFLLLWDSIAVPLMDAIATILKQQDAPFADIEDNF
ncbi:DUF2785 domain-containing protein [Ktedonospora formicarum]|uniref:Membrane protein n=1 Tax=Ktedonospora formicarum TaxID=2778364 RepID=A0A8J3I1D0_9CHLR|nr:DUF2785 domain-containing protein [Ktedonospora formicarum]GHO44452.1 membrane protein [Ktedonospora formicarum]